MAFKKAVREKSFARIALFGASGSGKTWNALVMAYVLGKRVALADSEWGTASKFQGETDPETGTVFDFDVDNLDSHSPDRYIQAIEDAQRGGYEVLIVDSLSHAWMGREGVLALADQASRKYSGNTYAGWRDASPRHNALVDALIRSRLHLIVTMRSKTEYVLEEVERGGRTTKAPKKIGLAPVQRADLEYEFDVVCALDQEHTIAVGKSRCRPLDRKEFPGNPAAFAVTYREWLLHGSDAAEEEIRSSGWEHSSAPAQPSPAKPAPRLEYDPGEGPPKRDSARAVRNARKVTSLRPPTRVREGDPVPRFSSQAKWDGAGKWSGRPLAEADLGTLVEYARVVQLAAAGNMGTPKGEVQRRHLGAIEETIARVAPGAELIEKDPWGLRSGGPPCRKCPSNPDCQHYARCLAERAAAEGAREGEG